jgi:hypothetical protein
VHSVEDSLNNSDGHAHAGAEQLSSERVAFSLIFGGCDTSRLHFFNQTFVS